MKTCPVGIVSPRATRDDEAPIMYMSFALHDVELWYHITEKETFAILKYLEEARWLVAGSQHAVEVYTEAYGSDITPLLRMS